MKNKILTKITGRDIESAILTNNDYLAKLFIDIEDKSINDCYDRYIQENDNIILASIYNNTSIIKYLISKGVNINVQERYNGYTPLMYAVAHNNIELVKLLLDNGADPHIRNAYKKTVFDYFKSEEIKELLSTYEKSKHIR